MAEFESQVRRDDPGGASVPAALSAADYAWEFLRRNPEYRAEYAKSGDGEVDPRWGLCFGADPARPAPNAAVYWRAEVAPGLVVPMEGEGPEVLSAFGPEGPVRRVGDAWRLNLQSGAQLLMRSGAKRQEPLVVVLAFDRDYRLRLRAAQALAAPTDAPRTRLSTAQQARLQRAMMALDGTLEHASYRTIAERVFGSSAVEREPWKTASLRDVTIRLVRTGLALMRGGYLKLVRAGA